MKVYATVGDVIEAIQIKELPIPDAKNEEILVSMKSLSLDFRDLLVINGIATWKPISQRIPILTPLGEIVFDDTKLSKLS